MSAIPTKIGLYIDENKEFNECYVSMERDNFKIAEVLAGFGINKREGLDNLMSELTELLECCKQLLEYDVQLVEDIKNPHLKLTKKV